MKRFDVEDLYQHYGKTRQRLTEEVAPNPESEKGIIWKDSGTRSLKGVKSDVVVYLEDPELVPTTVEVGFNFKIQFDSNAIHEDFVGVGTTSKGNKEISDDEADKLAQMAILKGTTPEEPKIQKFVDYDRVWMEIIRKQLGAYAMEHKVKDLQKAGIFSESLGDFTIEYVNLSSQVDEKVLLKTFIQLDRKLKNPPFPPVKVPFGYAVTLICKNKILHTKEQVVEVAKKFIPVFETNALTKSKYFDFVKK